MSSLTDRSLCNTTIDTPVGQLTLVAGDSGLVAVLWENDDPQRVPLGTLRRNESHPVLAAAKQQLREYFGGRRRDFDLPIDASGTPFQQAVWKALRTIPYGQTRSYAQIARQIGRPSAARAVGAANGRNPVSIIVPCHRVIGAGGQLTGFAGGLRVKAQLLALEGGTGQE